MQPAIEPDMPRLVAAPVTPQRPVFVYRVEIVAYPPRSHWSLPDYDPHWQPPGWEPEMVDNGPEEAPSLQGFLWPARRHYFDATGANERAERLRSYGAEVEVHRSLPVRWTAV